MNLDGWILRTVDPERGGAASKNLLRAMAQRRGYTTAECDRAIRRLIDERRLVMLGDRKGAMYALPGHQCTTRGRRRAR